SQPSFSAPLANTELLALGAWRQGATPKRCSICVNHGAISSALAPFTPCLSAQCLRVCAGVRKLDVQLTVVEPPTERPCSTAMAPSEVARPPASWYRSR